MISATSGTEKQYSSILIVLTIFLENFKTQESNSTKLNITIAYVRHTALHLIDSHFIKFSMECTHLKLPPIS